MQPRRNILEILAETLHDSDRVARHCVIGAPCAYDDQSEAGKDDHSARATTLHDPLKAILPPSDQILNIGGFGPATPGAASAEVAVLRWHSSVLSYKTLNQISITQVLTAKTPSPFSCVAFWQRWALD